MELPALIKDIPLRGCPQLYEHVTLFYEQGMVFNLTPAFTLSICIWVCPTNVFVLITLPEHDLR